MGQGDVIRTSTKLDCHVVGLGDSTNLGKIFMPRLTVHRPCSTTHTTVRAGVVTFTTLHCYNAPNAPVLQDGDCNYRINRISSSSPRFISVHAVEAAELQETV